MGEGWRDKADAAAEPGEGEGEKDEDDEEEEGVGSKENAARPDMSSD